MKAAKVRNVPQVRRDPTNHFWSDIDERSGTAGNDDEVLQRRKRFQTMDAPLILFSKDIIYPSFCFEKFHHCNYSLIITTKFERRTSNLDIPSSKFKVVSLSSQNSQAIISRCRRPCPLHGPPTLPPPSMSFQDQPKLAPTQKNSTKQTYRTHPRTAPPVHLIFSDRFSC